MQSIINVFYSRITFLYERNPLILYKYIILIILEKIIIFANTQDLIKCSNFSLIAQFIYRLLHTFDLMIITLSLLIIDAMINKMPSILNDFVREGVMERLNFLKNEKEIAKLSLIPLSKNQRGNSEIKSWNSFANANNFNSNGKYESVAEKMKNLNSLISRIDKNINDIYQPKLISNIKSSQSQEQKPEGNKKNMMDNLNSNKKNEILDKSQESKQSEEKCMFLNDMNNKIAVIKNDLTIFFKDLLMKISAASNSKGNVESLDRINYLLTEIAISFKDKAGTFGVDAFEKMLNFLKKYKKFTTYEIKTYKIITSINEFLFEGCLSFKNMDICEERSEVIFQNREIYEFSRGTDIEPFPEIEISDDQANKIVKRMFVMVNFLLNPNPANPQSI